MPRAGLSTAAVERLLILERVLELTPRNRGVRVDADGAISVYAVPPRTARITHSSALQGRGAVHRKKSAVVGDEERPSRAQQRAAERARREFEPAAAPLSRESQTEPTPVHEPEPTPKPAPAPEPSPDSPMQPEPGQLELPPQRAVGFSTPEKRSPKAGPKSPPSLDEVIRRSERHGRKARPPPTPEEQKSKPSSSSRAAAAKKGRRDVAAEFATAAAPLAADAAATEAAGAAAEAAATPACAPARHPADAFPTLTGALATTSFVEDCSHTRPNVWLGEPASKEDFEARLAELTEFGPAVDPRQGGEPRGPSRTPVVEAGERWDVSALAEMAAGVAPLSFDLLDALDI